MLNIYSKRYPADGLEERRPSTDSAVSVQSGRMNTDKTLQVRTCSFGFPELEPDTTPTGV